jgi:hypothetical protein
MHTSRKAHILERDEYDGLVRENAPLDERAAIVQPSGAASGRAATV